MQPENFHGVIQRTGEPNHQSRRPHSPNNLFSMRRVLSMPLWKKRAVSFLFALAVIATAPEFCFEKLLRFTIFNKATYMHRLKHLKQCQHEAVDHLVSHQGPTFCVSFLCSC